MFSHGLISAALFMCIGIVYDRLHTRLIADYGGLVSHMPNFAVFSCSLQWLILHYQELVDLLENF